MNKLTLSLILLMSYGCSQPLFNSRSVIAPVTSPSGCSQTSKVNLNQQNITEVVLDEQMLVKSGRVTATEAVGYRFDAQQGQTFTYNTNDDICIVVYTPDNQIITSGELPTSGKYIVQVSAPQNDRAFGLGMSLTSPVVEDIPQTPTPEPTTVNTAATPPTTNQTTVKNTPRRTKTRRPRPVNTASSSTTEQTTVNDTPSAETPEPTTVDTASSSTTDQTTVNDTPSAETPEPTTVDTASSSPTTETQPLEPLNYPSANHSVVSNPTTTHGENGLSSPNNQSAIEAVVNSFYSELNRGNYQNSWDKLSHELQNNQQDHPDGYNSYIEWWTKVSRVEPRIIKSEFNDNYGTVNVRSKLYLNSGKVINAVVQYNLVWNPDYEKWEINKIRLIG